MTRIDFFLLLYSSVNKKKKKKKNSEIANNREGKKGRVREREQPIGRQPMKATLI